MTTDILKDWLRDMPMQFLGKRNIEVLIKAFARQMQELDTVFEELNTKTDLDTAMGQNLDYVGTIIPLSRKEAGELVNKRFHEPVISDYRYRQYLKYRLLRNTCDCTYYNIMKAIEILWDVNKVYYYEREDRPATIFIGLPTVSVDDDDQAKGKPSIMKPAGVGFFYTGQYSMIVDQSALETIRLMCLDVHLFLYFFKRVLNGNWPLDGSVSLGQVMLCEIAMGIVIGIISIAHGCKVLIPGLDVFVAFTGVLPITQYSMEIKYRLELLGIWGISVENIGVDIFIHERVLVEADFVTIKKDLWYLDGQIPMDGSRILDAEIWKERL